LCTFAVALRKESVDRNTSTMQNSVMLNQSLSARRAWIEILIFLLFRLNLQVALRKESVDRNNRM